MSKKISYFDEFIDPECVPLIIALNQLKGVRTFESCCGHLKEPFYIWLQCNNLTSIAIISRTFDNRYSDGKWEVLLETSDIINPPFKTFAICIKTKNRFKSWNEMFKSINNATHYLNYWNEKKFKNHFNGIEEHRSE